MIRLRRTAIALPLLADSPEDADGGLVRESVHGNAADTVPAAPWAPEPRGRSAQWRMFTALATISPSVTSETSDWRPITALARGVSGAVSVGLKAVAFVSET